MRCLLIRKWITTCCFFFAFFQLLLAGRPSAFYEFQDATIDTFLQKMSVEEKVSQLLVWEVDGQKEHKPRKVLQAIQQNQVGGLWIKGWNPTDFLQFQNQSKQQSKLPLFWVSSHNILLNGQFQSASSFPGKETLLAAGQDTLLPALSKMYLNQLEAAGINLVLPNEKQELQWNEEERQFLGANRILTIQAYESSNLKRRADSLSWVWPMLPKYDPMDLEDAGMAISNKALIDSYLKHALVTNPNQPSNSYPGLILTQFDQHSDLQTLLLAGTHILVSKQNPNKIHNRILSLVQSGTISEDLLNGKVRTILKAKWWTEGPNYGKAFRANFRTPQRPRLSRNQRQLINNLGDKSWEYTKQYILEKSLVLVNNPNTTLPLEELTQHNYQVYSYGAESLNDLLKSIGKYTNYTSYSYPVIYGTVLELPNEAIDPNKTELIILSNLFLRAPQNLEFIQAINNRAREQRLVVINFGDPLNLAYFDEQVPMIQVFERNKISESLVGQLLFGGLSPKGKLPVSISLKYPKGYGLSFPKTRLKFTVPEEVGVDPTKLVGIDAIAKSAIGEGAIPGCQVLVAKEGKVIYSKAFGHFTFQEKQEVSIDHLYDLASITKIAATTLAAMKLYEDKKFYLSDRLRMHLPMAKNASIRNLNLRQLFIHKSGLQPHMPVIKYLRHRGEFNADCTSYFCKYQDEKYAVQVADSFYIDFHCQDTVWQKVQKLRVNRRKRYKYSDVNFYLIQQMIEHKTKLPLDQFVDQNFYEGLGLRRCMFNPIKEFSKNELPPTENDYKWRNQLVHGYVHDETAALYGGVGGHAGLFANAEDLAVLMQLLLDGGVYGGKTYLKPETIKRFTTAETGTHRGLGFDKPRTKGYFATATSASKETFGHTGFTGTCAWADPKHDLVYIFLSNRIHPSVSNKKLFRNGVRERIHQVIYDALDTYTLELPVLDLNGIQN